MRPLELRLRNFRSYFGPEQVFDFRGRRLVGIVGPIGSGKSSILDAVAFALYGKTPTIGRSTKALIHQRADDGGVALRFEVDGEIWEAQRVLRRSGQSQHALYRLEADVAGDPVFAARLVQESEVNAKVAELLGLEFDAFTRSVLLAQGRFAEFLSAPPADRDKVLKGLFGLGRVDLMRDLARERHREAEGEAEKAAIRVEQLVEHEERLEAERAELAEARERVEALSDAEPGIVELAAERDEMSREQHRLEERLAVLDDIAHRLPDEAAGKELLDQMASAGDTRRRLGLDLDEAEKSLRLARAGLAVVAEEATVIDEATALLAENRTLAERAGDVSTRCDALRGRIAAAIEAVAAAAEDVVVAVTELEETAGDVAGAAESLAEAEDRLHEARHANMAMDLRAGLIAGEACPVCEQVVASPPEPMVDAGVEQATEAVAIARSALRERDQVRLDAAGREAACRAALVSAESLVGRLGEDLAAEEAKLGPLLDAAGVVTGRLSALLGGDDHGALLAALKDRAADALLVASTAETAVERARADLDEAIATQQHLEGALGDLRVRLADAAARLGMDLEVGEGPGAIAGAVAELMKAWTADGADTRERIAFLAERAATVTAKWEELLAALGVEGDFTAALARARGRVDQLSQTVARTERSVAEGEQVRRDLRLHLDRRDVFGRLASDLTDARFVRYLLDEERTRLSLLGSEHFQRLSSGRYRFSEDGKFDIADLTAADAIRRPESLSGGETFLASLGLAIALAEMVTRTGGRLDAFFLDEGFGTLDPEHLDLAMEGVEALAADGSDRLVVVVSHVPDLRHRLDDLIVLDRDPMTGDTRVLAA